MSTTVMEDFTERRAITRSAIENLVARRQEMLVLYCRVAGLEPYTPDKPVQTLLDEFCEVMIDYAALGHFEVYQRIAEGRERRKGVLDTAKDVYSRIAETSNVVVDFNDKYESMDADLIANTLSDDLSTLGEEMAVRIELEDQLIEALLYH